MEEYKILKEKNVFNKALVIREGEISDGHNTFSRLGVDREDAAAIFILNTDSNKVVLTKQFRYAVAFKTNEPILEIPAGKINEGEDAFEAAIREAEEETGYKIDPRNLKLLLSCFSSPGYSAERFFIYYATVTNADKIHEGGGIENENERIEVIEMNQHEFDLHIKEGTLEDAKTYLAGLQILLNNT